MLRPMLIQAPRDRHRRHGGMLCPQARVAVILDWKFLDDILNGGRCGTLGEVRGRRCGLGIVRGGARSLLLLLGGSGRRVAKDQFLLGSVAGAFGAVLDAAIALWSSKIALRMSITAMSSFMREQCPTLTRRRRQR